MRLLRSWIHHFRSWIYHLSQTVSLQTLLVVPFALQTLGAATLVGYLCYRSGQKSVERVMQQIADQAESCSTDWFSMLIALEPTFLGVPRHHLLPMLFLIGVTLLTTLLTGTMTARWVTQPLLQLNWAAKRIADGDLTVPMKIDRQDAVGELARSFDKMTQRLQEVFHQLQIALSESEDRFAKVFSASPDPIAITSWLEGRWLEVNDSFLSLTEYTYAEVIGATAADLNLFVSADEAAAIAHQLQTEGFIHNSEIRWRTRSGAVKTLLISCEQIELSGQPYVMMVAKDIGDRKTVENALRESEARNRAILAAIPDLMSLFDRNGIYIASIKSNHALDLIPATSNPVGKSIADLLPPAVAQQQTEAIQVALSTKTVVVFEQEVSTAGGIRYEEVRVAACGEDAALCMIRDISAAKRLEIDRQQAKAELQAQKDFLRQVIDVVPSAIFVKNRENQFLAANQAAAVIYKTTVEELIGRKDDAFNPDPDQIHSYYSTNLEVMATRQPKRIPLEPITTLEGETRWYQTVISPLIDTQGEVWGIVGNALDVTERKQSEEALRESEERFRSAFEDAAVGMALIAPSGRFLRVNRSLCDLLGYTADELLLHHTHEITDPEDLPLSLDRRQRSLAGELRTYQVEKRYVHKRGHTIWVQLNVSLVRDGQGCPLYFISQIQDISDRREVAQLKDEFISIVSHELRTPLTAIRGSLGLLAAGIYDHHPAKMKRMIEIALTDSDRLVRLVNDILDLERLESGAQKFVMERCSAATLMRQATDGMRAIADAAHIRLAVKPVDAHIWATPDAMIQTLTNLLSNAIKFSPAGSTVWLSAEQSANEVTFHVVDRGRGIPTDKLAVIFNRFQQVDISDSRQKGGTGLGLAICQSIVDRHGGRIWVESVLGEGSTFSFSIPNPPYSDRTSDSAIEGQFA